MEEKSLGHLGVKKKKKKGPGFQGFIQEKPFVARILFALLLFFFLFIRIMLLLSYTIYLLLLQSVIVVVIVFVCVSARFF